MTPQNLIARATPPSPLGPLTAAATSRGIARLWFDTPARAGLRPCRNEPGQRWLAQLAAELAAYWVDGRRTFTVPLDLQGTAFQQAVWQALRTIPPGATRSYGDIAVMAGSAAAVRAVGAAMRRQPGRHRRALPPRDRPRRHAHRLRGRPAAQGGAAAPRVGAGRAGGLTGLPRRRRMRPRDMAELLLLAALWGAAFLFMRVAAPVFGPVALVFVRVAGAALVLLPLLLSRGGGPALRQHWRRIAVVGVTNSALPFLCFTVAALALDGRPVGDLQRDDAAVGRLHRLGLAAATGRARCAASAWRSAWPAWRCWWPTRPACGRANTASARRWPWPRAWPRPRCTVCRRT